MTAVIDKTAEAAKALTVKQRQVYDYMRAFLAENDELPPMWAVAKHFGYKSMNAARCHVEMLMRKGFIERNAIGNLRFVRATQEGAACQ